VRRVVLALGGLAADKLGIQITSDPWLAIQRGQDAGLPPAAALTTGMETESGSWSLEGRGSMGPGRAASSDVPCGTQRGGSVPLPTG